MKRTAKWYGRKIGQTARKRKRRSEPWPYLFADTSRFIQSTVVGGRRYAVRGRRLRHLLCAQGSSHLVGKMAGDVMDGGRRVVQSASWLISLFNAMLYKELCTFFSVGPTFMKAF